MVNAMKVSSREALDDDVENILESGSSQKSERKVQSAGKTTKTAPYICVSGPLGPGCVAGLEQLPTS